MGCDIHGWVEKKTDKGWIGIAELKDRDRNYGRFAMLAGVRGDGPDPLGIPDDVSQTTEYYIDVWDGDGHSHSFIPLVEAARIFAATAFNSASKNPIEDHFGLDVYEDGAEAQDYRLVFWFDN
jgi:hypothetical protein